MGETIVNMHLLADDKKIHSTIFPHRFKELDGLRGIAALTVAVDHGFGAAILMPKAAFGSSFIALAALFINAVVAVDLFFIMSGFFLAGMLERLRASTLWEFYLRRFIRLVPPAVTAVALLYLYSRLAFTNKPPVPGETEFIPDFFLVNHDISIKSILLNLAIIRHDLNPPLWTIRLELLTSIIFPAIFFIKNYRQSFIYRIGLFGVFFILALLLNSHQKLGIDVFHYLYLFYAGVLIRDFGQQAEKIPAFAQYVMFAAAIIGLVLVVLYIPTNGIHPISFDLPVTIFGTILILLLAVGGISNIRHFMNSPFIQFTGRISYSFYLMNWLGDLIAGTLTINTGIASHCGAFLTVFCTDIGTVIITIILGYLLHITVEKPAAAFSRRIGRSNNKISAPVKS